MYSNDEATLTLYKTSAWGVCRDYVIRFNQQQCDIKDIIHIASDIVKFLIDDFHQKDKTIKGRLVARVCYAHAANEDEVMYYHPSYRSEMNDDAIEFFTTHMLKIAQRMDNFNYLGSRLLIKHVAEIYLHITCIN